jgi:hypothetical protein
MDSALERVDDALSSATKVETRTSKDVDMKLEEAICALCQYETDCHRKDSVSDDTCDKRIRERMAVAKAKDRSSLGALNALKEKLRSKVSVGPAHSIFVFCLYVPSADPGWMVGTNESC